MQDFCSGRLFKFEYEEWLLCLLKFKFYCFAVGFDGRLKTVVDKGSANIHLSRINEQSEVTIINGSLALKLSDSCQDYTRFRIKTLDYEISNRIKMVPKNSEGILNLLPDINEQNIVNINCMNGSVDVDSASWQDMVRIKLEKNIP